VNRRVQAPVEARGGGIDWDGPRDSWSPRIHIVRNQLGIRAHILIEEHKSQHNQENEQWRHLVLTNISFDSKNLERS